MALAPVRTPRREIAEASAKRENAMMDIPGTSVPAGCGVINVNPPRALYHDYSGGDQARAGMAGWRPESPSPGASRLDLTAICPTVTNLVIAAGAGRSRRRVASRRKEPKVHTESSHPNDRVNNRCEPLCGIAMNWRRLAVAPSFMVLLVAAGPVTAQEPLPPLLSSGLPGEVTADRLPMPADPDLRLGRNIWQANCQYCHGTGLAGAPKITDRRAWAPRLAAGVEKLFERTKNGFIGAGGAEMPPRGGASSLSDDEIKSALVYMIANSSDGPTAR